MREKSLVTLEFAKIREQLAAQTVTPMGRALATMLRPSPDPAEVARRQQETREALLLAAEASPPALGGAQDIRPLLHRADKGGVLEPKDLLIIAATAATARTVRQGLLRRSQQTPALAGLAEGIQDLQELEREIGRVLGPDALVKDTASPLLQAVREELRRVHDQIVHLLRGIIASSHGQEALQEPLVTQRSGRYVLPIKAERRGVLPGIVHDVSGSGATLFVEPFATVELGNRHRELQAQEEHEVQRLLQRLSYQVAAQSQALSQAVRALARLDLAFAKARYARALNATEPELVPSREGGLIRLKEARHPFLAGRAVPISLEVGGPSPILLITGPNTGGKTVALKTMGLLALMHQAGLQVPASSGTRLPVFQDIFADIGDEQSIEQSLSTFSSHMTNIVEIVRKADKDSLVLLDELGAGTDPEEGAALAQAILAHLLRRRVPTLATSHQGDLKAFAQVTPGIRNASVEFNAQTLEPTYRVLMDVPGQSNALAIARRLGLDPDVLQGAEARLGRPHLEWNQLLLQAQEDRRAVEEHRRAAQADAVQVQELRASLEARLAEVEQEKARGRETAYREAVKESRRLLLRLQRVRAALDNRLIRRANVPEILREVEEVQQELLQTLRSSPAQEGQPRPAPRPGDPVWLPEDGLRGTLLSDPDRAGEVEVQMGSLRARVPWHQVEALPSDLPPSQAPPGERQPPAPGAVPPELSLRGMFAEEARELLERTLNAAFLADLPTLRVIHGKGNGVLRKAVHDLLRGHPLVESFQHAEDAQGGDGVTLARLAPRRL